MYVTLLLLCIGIMHIPSTCTCSLVPASSKTCIKMPAQSANNLIQVVSSVDKQKPVVFIVSISHTAQSDTSVTHTFKKLPKKIVLTTFIYNLRLGLS